MHGVIVTPPTVSFRTFGVGCRPLRGHEAPHVYGRKGAITVDKEPCRRDILLFLRTWQLCREFAVRGQPWAFAYRFNKRDVSPWQLPQAAAFTEAVDTAVRTVAVQDVGGKVARLQLCLPHIVL